MTDFEALIESIACPGFHFTVVGERDAKVTMDCATSPSGLLGAAPRRYAEGLDVAAIVADLLMVASYLATHEIEEQFRVGGEPFHSPHPDPLLKLSLPPVLIRRSA